MIDYAWSLRNMGSSPLARGKSYPDRFRNGNEGFIPTRAGKIRGTLTILLRVTVHPHSRGENLASFSHLRDIAGSSPLARGKCHTIDLIPLLLRFIPTRAGKIGHLRVNHQYPIGSSPLARGKLPGPQTSCVVCRFIPTRAGKMVLVAV